jgi:hypothetical protein
MKNCFLITSYCDTTQKIEILNECIDNLKFISNNDICLHAHYPLDYNIQKQLNYYLYDSSNPVLKYPEKYITWWRTFGNLTLNIYKEDYGYAVLQQWKRGFDFLKNLYDNIIILNYDVNITKRLLEQIENKCDFEGCSFLHENSNTITPLLSISTKSKLFDKISLERYKIINGFAENFAEYIFADSNCYRFNFDEYKNDYYTMLDFEGSFKFRDNKLTQHSSPYDSMHFDNFDIFFGEKNNNLNVLFYNLKQNLNVKILYNSDEIYVNYLNYNNFYLIDTKLIFFELDIDKLFVVVNDKILNIDKNIINYCKIILKIFLK